jgi:hypothetical protein
MMCLDESKAGKAVLLRGAISLVAALGDDLKGI